ncbi:hypothetical protein [Phaeodactylibacter xiamenensis]|uniref:hypothetical protein n=1 Tax=Phaeodactylibacter xiamenensis TaxID=1524460 RepID=UPI003BAB2760
MVIHKGQTPVKPKPPTLAKVALVILAALLSLYAAYEITKDIPGLSPERQAKLNRELEELENTEQYVLRAARDGWYPCYSCPGKKRIFLHKDEVWKYGVTRKGEARRYGRWHQEQGLYYLVQYEGPLQECLRREKIQIYSYALLPENLRREQPLIRPTGACIQTFIVWETNAIPDGRCHY